MLRDVTPVRWLASFLCSGLLLSAPLAADSRAAPGQGKPLATLSIGDAYAYEDEGVIRFPITLSAPATGPVSIKAVPLPESALPVQDFRPGVVRTTIPAGAMSGELVVSIRSRAGVEPDRRFKLALVGKPGVRVQKPAAHGIIRDADPLAINVLHINDHHSHLQPDPGTLNLGTAGGTFQVPYGGFPRVTAKIREREEQLDNVVKVHAGDAITGTLFYSLFKGQADADLMNTVCFDLFALGNHEFDDSDVGLAQFLDWLNDNPVCETTTIAANVVPALGTPLAPLGAQDYIVPYAIRSFDGQRVGFIGIDIAQKTRVSSQPLASTQFLDEVETAQRYVDELKRRGVDNIVLVTHQGYSNDLALAQAVSGVDAIIGGDSHSLLGDFAQYGVASSGPYPTWTTNLDGDPVCVAQAWQYSWVVGELGVTFRKGKLDACGGTPHLLLGDQIRRGNAPIAEPELSEILARIDAAPELSLVTPDPDAQFILDGYAVQVNELSQQIIGAAAEPICERRMPNRPRGTNVAGCADGTPPDAVAASSAQLSINGGFIQQLVTDAFLARAFRADLALQNAGGVRIALPTGPISIGAAFTVLPFSNTLVELELSGQEILDSIEEGLGNFVDFAGSDGAYPYGSGIRWDADLTQPRGSRFSNVEVRERATGAWGPIDPARTYVVVTNSFLAGGGDGYATFRRARDEGRVTDTFINYAQGLIDYLQRDLGGAPAPVPALEDFSTQSFRN